MNVSISACAKLLWQERFVMQNKPNPARLGALVSANCYLDFSNPLQIPLPKTQSEQCPFLRIKEMKAKRRGEPSCKRVPVPKHLQEEPCAAPDSSCGGCPPFQGLVSSKGLFVDPKYPFFLAEISVTTLAGSPGLRLDVPGCILPQCCRSGCPMRNLVCVLAEARCY